MATISKADLVKELAEKTGVAAKDTKALVDGLFESVGAHLKSSDKVQITGFGTFEVRERRARTDVRLGTSEKIEIPASKYPAFKAGKSFKNQLS